MMMKLCLLMYFLLAYNGNGFFTTRLSTRLWQSRTRMVSNRNETSYKTNPRPFFSPIFEDSMGINSNHKDQWTKSLQTKGIIPTGPEGLARIEQNDEKNNVHAKILDGNTNNEAEKYFKMIESLAPNDMLLKFTRTAPKHVQEAAKSTIINLLGSIPNYALDAALITTNAKLVNLLYQMQMTGYLFKSAEYRMSLTKALKGLPRLPSSSVLHPVNNITVSLSLHNRNSSTNGSTNSSTHLHDEVEQLTSALSREISELRAELAVVRDEREQELRSNILTYIQALPEQELIHLTADVSDDVVIAMEMLVEALMHKLHIPSRDKEVLIQQSVGQLAQLCMWQMVIGYKLRELEALEKGANLT